ncbi:MAG: hypothetical protein ABSE82_15605 [Nitrososphaerales archaeon]
MLTKDSITIGIESRDTAHEVHIMTYYVTIEFTNRDSINLYSGTSDRLAHVYLDIARGLITAFNATDASIIFANADSRGRINAAPAQIETVEDACARIESDTDDCE